MKATLTKEYTKETRAKITIWHWVYENENSYNLIEASCELYSNTADWYQNIEAANEMYNVESMQIWELKIFK